MAEVRSLGPVRAEGAVQRGHRADSFHSSPMHKHVRQTDADEPQLTTREGAAVEEEGRFPYRFFVVTFAWSWLIWLPLVLAGAGVFPLGKGLLAGLTVPWIFLGAFGPAEGAFYCLRTSLGKGAV